MDVADKIAVVGASCRLPGMKDLSGNLEGLWTLLCSSSEKDLPFKPVPPQRWALAPSTKRPTPGQEEEEEHRALEAGRLPAGQPEAALLEDVEVWDPSVLCGSEQLAESEVPWLDPHHRLLLAATSHALRAAGLKPGPRLRSRRVGVWVGMSNHEWRAVCPEETSAATERGHATPAGLISKCFGLKGPSYSTDTACTSSVSALELAVQSLRQGRCELAVVGGVHLLLSPATHQQRQAAGRLGREHPRLGEGCGVVVLQRARQARAEGRVVRALVGGVATGYVGDGSTREQEEAQRELVRQALQDAGVEPREVSFVELSSSTGVPSEDRRHVEAVLQPVYCQQQQDDDGGRPLLLGCVKSWVGQLDGAAGMAGLFQALLVLQHAQVPAQSQHLRKTLLGASSSTSSRPVGRAKEGAGRPWVVPSSPAGLVRGAGPGGRLAVGLSCLSWTGMAAHVVLLEDKEEEEDEPPKRLHDKAPAAPARPPPRSPLSRRRSTTGSSSASASSSSSSPPSSSSSASSSPLLPLEPAGLPPPLPVVAYERPKLKRPVDMPLLASSSNNSGSNGGGGGARGEGEGGGVVSPKPWRQSSSSGGGGGPVVRSSGVEVVDLVSSSDDDDDQLARESSSTTTTSTTPSALGKQRLQPERREKEAAVEVDEGDDLVEVVAVTPPPGTKTKQRPAADPSASSSASQQEGSSSGVSPPAAPVELARLPEEEEEEQGGGSQPSAPTVPSSPLQDDEEAATAAMDIDKTAAEEEDKDGEDGDDEMEDDEDEHEPSPATTSGASSSSPSRLGDDDEEEDEEQQTPGGSSSSALAPPSLPRRYPWWFTPVQMRRQLLGHDDDHDEDEGTNSEDDDARSSNSSRAALPVAGAKRKRGRPGGGSKRASSSGGSKKRASSSTTVSKEEQERRRLADEKLRAEVKQAVQNLPKPKRQGGDNLDAEGFMAAVRGRDERVVRVWLECGYVCHTAALLALLKWGHAELLKRALSGVPADGEQLLARVTIERGDRQLKGFGVDEVAGASLLHMAVMYDQPHAIPLLLPKLLKQKGKASLSQCVLQDKQGLDPLHWAVRVGRLECVQALLAAKHVQTTHDKMGNPPLLWTQPESICCLMGMLEHGADLNVEDAQGRTLLFWSLLYQDPEQHLAHVKKGQAPPSSDELKRRCEAWRGLAAQIRGKGADYGRQMLVECSIDISVGLETRPVPVVLPPAAASSSSGGGGGPARPYPLFAYSVESVNNPLVSSAQCCHCVDDCRKNRNCPCRLRYAAGLPYDGDTDNLRQGAMTMKTPLFECGPKCSCNKKVCRLQITRESLGVDVEVRWHPAKQFSVNCKQDIPMGAYVATYVGEYMNMQQALARTTDESLASHYIPHYQTEVQVQGGFIVVDAGLLGSVARLFNHSCTPNLSLLKVASHRLHPKVAFFANRDIAAGEELTFDYCPQNGKLASSKRRQSSEGADGGMACMCGADKCRGFI